MPKLVQKSMTPAPVVAAWDKMYAVLEAHEKTHGAHGIQAAQEIARDQCRNGDAIIDKWAKQDKIYDRKTRHGKTEGVGF